MSITVGNIKAGRDINIAEGNISISRGDLPEDLRSNKKLLQLLEELNKHIEKKDESNIKKYLGFIGDISSSAVSSIATKYIVSLLGKL